MNQQLNINPSHDSYVKDQIMAQNLLKARAQLIYFLLKFPSNNKNKMNSYLDNFLQILIDYVSTFHFGFYRQILEKTMVNETLSNLAVSAYPKIERFTDISLEFDKKYNSINRYKNMDNLRKNLSILGEELMIRAEMEDRLIHSLFNLDS